MHPVTLVRMRVQHMHVRPGLGLTVHVVCAIDVDPRSIVAIGTVSSVVAMCTQAARGGGNVTARLHVSHHLARGTGPNRWGGRASAMSMSGGVHMRMHMHDA